MSKQEEFRVEVKLSRDDIDSLMQAINMAEGEFARALKDDSNTWNDVLSKKQIQSRIDELSKQYERFGDIDIKYFAEDDYENDDDIDPDDQEAYDKFIANGHTEDELFDKKQAEMKEDFKTYFNDKYQTDYKSFDEINEAYQNGELSLDDQPVSDAEIEYYNADGIDSDEYRSPIQRIDGCMSQGLYGTDDELNDEGILDRLGNPDDYEVVELAVPDTSTLDYSVPEKNRCYEVMRTRIEDPMKQIYEINKADELAKANTSVEPSEE